MSKIPPHLQKGKQKSQIEKKKDAEKSRAEMLKDLILEDENTELQDELNDGSQNDSQDDSENKSENKSNTTTNDLLASVLKIEKKKKPKEKANLYLEEDVMDKLRTLSIKTDKSITTIVEELLVEILKDTEVDEASVRRYKKKNKSKGNKSKK